MKKIIALVIIAICITIGAYAQTLNKSEVPDIIKTKVATLYPNSNVEWMRDSDGNYQVDFEDNKTEICLTISMLGNLLNTKIKISIAELPTSVIDFMIKKRPGKPIDAAFKENDNNGILITYKANVEKTCFIFNSKGAYLYSITQNPEYRKYQNQ
jgi:hypothetical protein